MNRLLSILILIILFSGLVFADQNAITESGIKVILKDDGTWKYNHENNIKDNTVNISDDDFVLNELKKWKEKLMYSWAKGNKIKYVKFIQDSFELITPQDPRYKYLELDKVGKELLIHEYVYICKAKDLWENKEIFLYISASPKSDKKGIYYQIFDGENCFDQYDEQIVNPKLVDNPREYYITYQDNSVCQLKILAYKIEIGDYGNVSVDLIVKNNSKKAIAGFRGTFILYDKMNHPVTWGGSENKFNFICQNESIPALSHATIIGSWKLSLYDNTRRIKPYIREIQYEDGTKWILK